MVGWRSPVVVDWDDGAEPAIAGATVFLLDGVGDRIQDANGNDISTTTDASGAYEFAGLPAGDYRVEFVAPGGYTFTTSNTGGDDTVDSDGNETSGLTASTNLSPGEVDDTLDAGFVRLDYGDLPDGYGTTNGSTNGSARHVLDGITYLGSAVDFETDGQPTADATGDGVDEDGIVFNGPLTAGATTTIDVTTSAAGFLNRQPQETWRHDSAIPLMRWGQVEVQTVRR